MVFDVTFSLQQINLQDIEEVEIKMESINLQPSAIINNMKSKATNTQETRLDDVCADAVFSN